MIALDESTGRLPRRIAFIVLLVLSVALWVVILMPLRACLAQGIGQSHGIGTSPIGLPTDAPIEPGKYYQLNDQRVLKEVPAPASNSTVLGGYTNLPASILSGQTTPQLSAEDKLRAAYEFCLTDFVKSRTTSTSEPNGVEIEYTDPSCAEVAKLWSTSTAKAHYEAEMADWNKARIAREKQVIDQAVKEGK